MIITKLVGGLGNQMFQYAVARRLAYVKNDSLKLDTTEYQNDPLRWYCLEQLNISHNIASDGEIADLKNGNWVREKHFHFDPEILKLGSNVYLEGYWQSEKYFQDISPIIRQDFQVKRPLTGLNLKTAGIIGNCQSVAVHVRRGDYVANPVTNHWHGVCPVGYYQQAMAFLTQRIPQSRFFIFSDDPDWARQHIGRGFACSFITHNNARNGFEDLRLMILCQHHIIANSTFSWWGAWLAANQAKIVVAPRQWFNQADFNTQDLIPDGWQSL